MIDGMTTQKIAITVPRETLAKARKAVRAGRAGSLSAYVSRALEQKTMLDDLDALLEELLAGTGGPMTPEERRRADARLGEKPRRGRRR